MRLIYKVTSILVVATVIITVVVIFSFSTFMKTALEEQIKTNQSALAVGQMNSIDRVLYERYVSIQALAEDDTFEKLLSNSLLVSENQPDSDNQQDESLTAPQTSEDDKIPEDVQQEGVRFADASTASHKKLEESLLLTGPWDDLQVVSLHKVIVSSDSELEVGQQLSSTHRSIVFEAVIKSEKPYYSDVVVSSENNKPTVIFASPVRNEEMVGQPVVGVVIGQLSWSVVEEILGKIVDREAHLVNNKGQLIADNGTRHKGEIFEDFSDSLAVQHALAGRDGSMLHKAFDGDYQSFVSHVSQKGYLGFEELGWGLVLDTPTETLFAGVDKGIRVVATRIALFMLLMLFGVLVFVYFYITKPINQLSQVAGAIVKGDLDTRAIVRGNDEFGQLAKSFNTMADSLVHIGEQSKAIIDTLPDPLFILDNAGVITNINPAAEEVLGIKEADLTGQKITQVIASRKNADGDNVESKNPKVIKYIPDPGQEEGE